LKQAEAHQQLLINELSHRAKNLLAIIQSIAQQSFKGEGSVPQMLARFEGRLGALSAAHGILTQERWEAVPLRRLICDTFTAVRSDDERLELEGPNLDLPPKVSVSLAMAIHELATNALKYGSLSNEAGRVKIAWTANGGRLHLRWKERGGPPVSEPARRGFGSRMIERGLAAELAGRVVIRFEPDGVLCEVDAPLPEHG
jgi:two-component sensor histidine kinase